MISETDKQTILPADTVSVDVLEPLLGKICQFLQQNAHKESSIQ